MRPLAPLRPLTPTMKPLGPPPAPAGPSAPAATTTSVSSGGVQASTGTVNTAAPKGNAPFKITSFMNSQIPDAFTDAKGARITMKYFRVQFKITDASVASLDSAVVYLFNQKKELVGSLTDMNPQAKLAGVNASENVLNYPNMLSTLTGLEKNKSYNLIFMYQLNEIQFKYAVAVLGTKEMVVADTIPGSAHVQDFNFDGKDRLAQ